MPILSKQIQRFIHEIKTLQAIGCLLIPKSALAKLLTALNQASAIITAQPAKDQRLQFLELQANQELISVEAPKLLIVTEEDYASSAEWREKIRDKAAYFLNVSG